MLYVECERMFGFSSAHISLDLKKFSINILNKCIVLQFWWKLIILKILKTCLFRFLRDYYGDSLYVMFLQFPNHFLPFPMVFSHVSQCFNDFLRCLYCFPSVFPCFLPFSMVFSHASPSVSTISSVVSTVSPQCLPRFLF